MRRSRVPPSMLERRWRRARLRRACPTRPSGCCSACRQRVARRALAGAGEPWPVQGKIEQLPRARRIVLVGLDAWNELPVLALWIRKAVLAGAHAGRARRPTTACGATRRTGCEAEPLVAGEQLLTAALAAAPDTADRLRASGQARSSVSGLPALLAHPSLVADGRAAVRSACPCARHRHGRDLAPPARRQRPRRARLRTRRRSRPAPTRSSPAAPSARSATSPGPRCPRLVRAPDPGHVASPSPTTRASKSSCRWPIAYERQATLTNLEGRVQHQEGGASADRPRPRRLGHRGRAGAATRRGLGADSLDEIRRSWRTSSRRWLTCCSGVARRPCLTSSSTSSLADHHLRPAHGHGVHDLVRAARHQPPAGTHRPEPRRPNGLLQPRRRRAEAVLQRRHSARDGRPRGCTRWRPASRWSPRWPPSRSFPIGPTHHHRRAADRR